jgi:hypothetical protein
VHRFAALAIATAAAYMAAMRTPGVVVLVAALLALLAASVWYAVGFWSALESADMPPGIYLAMAGGIVFSLAVGIGLMTLVFYSSRHGYDDRAAGSDFRD